MEELVKRQAEFWDKFSGKYDKFVGYTDAYGMVKLKERGVRIINGARLEKSDRVLELCCGNGKLTKELVNAGYRLKAIDCSKKMIGLAKELGLASVEYEVGDIHKLPYGDEVFDAVVGSYFLRYVNIDIVAKEIRRVLRDGGRVSIQTVNGYNPINYWRGLWFVKKMRGTSEDTKNFTPRYLKRVFMENGFVNVKIKTFGYFDQAIPVRLIPMVCKVNKLLGVIPGINKIGGSCLFTAEVKK